MSQRDIIGLLEQNPDRWMSTIDLREAMAVNLSSLSDNVRKLRKFDMVEYKMEKRDKCQAIFYYKYKQVKEE